VLKIGGAGKHANGGSTTKITTVRFSGSEQSAWITDYNALSLIKGRALLGIDGKGNSLTDRGMERM